MRHLFSPLDAEVLPQLAASNALLAFDFDGTLAPIVARPDAAWMRADTRRLLAQVAQRYPCVVISGRAQRDALLRIEGVPLCEVVGNHGLEPSNNSARFERIVRKWLPPLRAALHPFAGIAVEDKGLSVAVHYRACRTKKAALAVLAQVVSRLGRVRVVGGKQVVNLIPEGGPSKALALERLKRKLGCDTALYAGDDETDEDVFALRQPGLITIQVGPRPGSLASYYLDDQEQIDRLLARLVELRRPAGRRSIA